MRILVVYYSFTSTVEKVAKSIEKSFGPDHEVTIRAIRPMRARPYWRWLLLSFLPGSSVAIADRPENLDAFDRICIGFPKWTFSCPPLNRYLSLLPRLPAGIPIGLFMAFGGFDEDRYFRRIAVKVSRKAKLVATLAVKRKLVDTAECMSLIRQFCEALIDGQSLCFAQTRFIARMKSAPAFFISSIARRPSSGCTLTARIASPSTVTPNPSFSASSVVVRTQ